MVFVFVQPKDQSLGMNSHSHSQGLRVLGAPRGRLMEAGYMRLKGGGYYRH